MRPAERNVKPGMRIRVIPQSVAPLRDLSRKSRKRAHTLANLKKSRPGVIPGKQVKQARRHRRIRAVVKCERHSVWGARTADRRSKKLRGGRYGGPREYPGGRCDAGTGEPGRQRIHKKRIFACDARIGQRNQNQVPAAYVRLRTASYR